MKKIISLALLSMFAAVQAAYAGTLWTDMSQSPFSAQRPYRKGDVVMVLIVESTSAVQKAGTDTAKQDSLSASFTHTIERLNPLIAPTNSLQGTYANTYKGSGTTNRSSNVLATVAVTVDNVLSNGNLSISGTHKLSINDETQEIVIAGIVRPADVTAWNTVYSYQVADSHVGIKGSGALGDASSPHIISRILNLIF